MSIGVLVVWRTGKLPASNDRFAGCARQSQDVITAGVRWHPTSFTEVDLALRIIIGLALTVIAFAIAGRRMWWLFRLATSGQPAPERIAAVRKHPARDAETQVTEVFGQDRKSTRLNSSH